MTGDTAAVATVTPGARLAAEEAVASMWGSGITVLDRLYREAGRFDFYQAVRMLELAGAERSGMGETGKLLDPPVRFRSRMGFAFPGSDVESVSRPAALGDGIDALAAEMIVNFIGLAGANGPLPVAFTGQLLDGGGSALRDFLDIFHHRLVLILYRMHAMHHPELTSIAPDEGLSASHLYAFIGLNPDAASAARHRLAVPDRALLHESGVLAHSPRSASGLECLLRDYFQVGVRTEEFAGAWLALEPEQWTKLGTRQGTNQVLGETAALGKRVWDQHAGVNVRIGPLDLKTFESFLPAGEAYPALRDLTRFYLGGEIEFSFLLVLDPHEIPRSVLGDGRDRHAPVRVELGRLSWLKSPERRGRGTDTPRPVQNVVRIRGDR